MPLFECLLIANRGEIACRIARTTRRLGIRTVAVYSDADAGAQHVAAADAAVRIGPAPARESYLNAAAIIQAARAEGAQAVHPGYGFLSENAAFAEQCAAAGITFIGPPPAAIRAMGSKIDAKRLMEATGVPLVPGYHGDEQEPDALAAQAQRIGFPVLIKASAGGGGKGMRIVERPEDFAEALAGARREALKAFGEDRVLIERYLTHPRHIEIQVFADTLGHCIHLHERDCSIQRRHQKILEEAPAPGLTPERRAAMGEAAVRAARAVGYVGAGTVEFIVSGEGTQDFYFMEMNTRLQVEHPVTEAITGIDLVEWQLKVAAGEPLSLIQAQVPLQGHALEARLYAENPAGGFLPSTGTLSLLRWPAPDAARIDTGVREGDEVSLHYDPMIAKLIVHGSDRPGALTRLRAALDACEIAGVKTNLELLRAIAAHPEFAAARIHTGFIEAHRGTLGLQSGGTATARAGDAAALENCAWTRADGWRLNLPPAPRRAEEDGRGGDRAAGPVGAQDGTLASPMPGQVLQINVKIGDAVKRGQPLMIIEAMKMEHTLLAPLDGRVESIAYAAGERVQEGAQLLKIEPATRQS